MTEGLKKSKSSYFTYPLANYMEVFIIVCLRNSFKLPKNNSLFRLNHTYLIYYHFHNIFSITYSLLYCLVYKYKCLHLFEISSTNHGQVMVYLYQALIQVCVFNLSNPDIYIYPIYTVIPSIVYLSSSNIVHHGFLP